MFTSTQLNPRAWGVHLLRLTLLQLAVDLGKALLLWGLTFFTGRTQRVSHASCSPGSYVTRVKEIPNEVTSMMRRKHLKKKGAG